MPALSPTLLSFCSQPMSHQPLPYYSTRIPAGFRSPAEDYLGDTLDLHELLVPRPAATFFARVAGESLVGVGIHDDDILVVDRSLTPSNGQVVIAALDGELLVKILQRQGGQVRLCSAHPAHAPIDVKDGEQLEIWGVVTAVVRPGLARGVADVRTGGL